MAARNTAFDLKPLCLINQAGTAIVPKLPGVRARAQRFALPVAAQHGARGHINHWQPGAGGTH